MVHIRSSLIDDLISFTMWYRLLGRKDFLFGIRIYLREIDLGRFFFIKRVAWCLRLRYFWIRMRFGILFSFLLVLCYLWDRSYHGKGYEYDWLLQVGCPSNVYFILYLLDLHRDWRKDLSYGCRCWRLERVGLRIGWGVSS